MTYRSWFALIGALIFITGAFLSDVGSGRTSSNIEFTTTGFIKFLDGRKETGNRLCNRFSSMDRRELWQATDDLPDNWGIRVFQDGQLAFWSDNQTPFDSLMMDTGTHVVSSISGWDLLVVRQINNEVVCAVFPLVRFAKGSVPGYTRLKDLAGLNFELSGSRKGTEWIEQYNVGLRFTGNNDTLWNLSYFFWIGVFILFLTMLSVKNSSLATHLIIIAGAVIFRILLYEHLFYDAIQHNRIFDPGIYASSYLLPSLGDLTIHILCSIIVIIHTGWILKKIRTTSEYGSYLFLWAVITGVLFLMDMLRSIIKGLVLDSQISFDITNLSQLDHFTMLAVGLILASMVAIFYFLYLTLQDRQYAIKTWIITFVIAAAGFVAFQMIDGKARFTTLLPSIVMVIILIIGLRRSTSRFWVTALVLVVFASGFTLQVIQSSINKKQNEYLQVYALKLIANKDLDAENRFLEIENDLVSEFLKPEDFENFSGKKDQFEKRLRRIYFSGQLDRYELKVLNFDSAGNNLDPTNFIRFKTLNHLYNEHSYPTLSHYFYQIKDPSLQNSFVAKFENCDIHGHYGHVFLLLQPKLIQTSYTYPSLLRKKMGSSLVELEDYSYAIYNNNSLLQQKGSYSYPMQFARSEFADDQVFAGYKHFILEHGKSNIAVLSYHNQNLLIYTSGLTFLFLFNVICIALALGLITTLRRWRLNYLSRRGSREEYEKHYAAHRQFITFWGFEQPLLSTRIQIAMFAVVSLGLLISVYFTIKYVEYNYTNRIEDELIFNLKEVSNHLQNEVNTSQKLMDHESRIQLVNQISNIYKLETNIFNTRGELIATSGPELYNDNVLARVMDPGAYRAMHINGASQFIHLEWIRDLSYLSAYVPLIDAERQVIAYLNLPYFTQQKELNKEISAYTVTLVNVYILLFIFALFVAYLVSTRITKPLKLIRDKIAATTLTTKNEMLDWKRNDEIGQLIRQYNKMVMELEESARKLSASEREGAWKEMARQVAHEIKNPLTPMKLNIQHLQRAWSDEQPNLPDTFKRVTQVLIDQIESLSRLAGEFSSFAQMPQTEFTSCAVNDLLRSTIHLYEKSENVEFRYSIPDQEVLVYADEEQLTRAFNNVIKNAIQSIPEDVHGIIEITFAADDTQVVISISDNGTGIPRDKRNKIFIPNFSTKTSGMGLGLAITKKIIETSGGTISFTTKEGQGTTFTITLPVHQG